MMLDNMKPPVSNDFPMVFLWFSGKIPMKSPKNTHDAGAGALGALESPGHEVHHHRHELRTKVFCSAPEGP